VGITLKYRTVFLLLFTLAAVVIAFLVHPIPQDPNYHHFADHRTIFGVPNFWNVVTNLPFLVIGMMGLHVLKTGKFSGGLVELRPTYQAFFIGVSFVAFGSAYYHWAPSNATLVWDRLPMTIAFMAFLSAIVAEYIDTIAGRRLLLPLLLIGAGSVMSWYLGDRHGGGDLRLYALVQFLPMLLIPLILMMYPPRMVPTCYLWSVLVAYGLSKLAEFWDGSIFTLSHGLISGHSLKHLLAGLGTYGFLLALRRRSPRNVPVIVEPKNSAAY